MMSMTSFLGNNGSITDRCLDWMIEKTEGNFTPGELRLAPRFESLCDYCSMIPDQLRCCNTNS